MSKICPVFNINRMVREYALKMYFPAGKNYGDLLLDGCERAKALAAWKGRLHGVWQDVKIVSIETGGKPVLKVGDDVQVKAWVQLGDLTPQDVSVQIYYGKINTTGDIIGGEIAPMALTEEKKGSALLFTGMVRYFKSGKHGFTVRVLPHHLD